MLPFKVIFFDLGSTLIYFDGDWPSVLAEGSKPLARTLISAGLKLNEGDFAKEFVRTLQDIEKRREQDHVEITIETILRTLLANKGYPGVNANILRPAINAYFAVTRPHWRAEDDASSTLASLQSLGCRLAVISNGSDVQNTDALLNSTGLRSFFKKTWVSAETGFRKPHPRMYELALDYFQIRPKEAVMIGDSLSADILGANNLGIASIWITRRADTPENRSDKLRIIPDQTVSRLGELPSLLMNW